MISEHSFENKDQLRREEDKHICQSLSDPKCLNCRREIITKEELKEHLTNYYYKNQKDIIAKSREYYHKHKEENKQLRHQYNLDHRQQKHDYDQKYREQNREKIMERKSQTIICSCGEEVCREHIQRHQKTKLHNNLINNIELQKEVECECGSMVNRYNLKRHKQSNKHKMFLVNVEKDNINKTELGDVITL